MTTTDAIDVLTRFAAKNVGSLDADHQIEIYWALSLTLPDEVSRSTARKLAEQQSAIAVLQMELHLAMNPNQEQG